MRVLSFNTLLPIIPLVAFLVSTTVVRQTQQQRNSLCGKTLIAYGNDDTRVHSPWTALLLRRTTQTKGAGTYLPWISGVIVGPRTILTRGRQFWEAGKFDNKRPRMHGFKSDDVLVGVGIYDSNSFTLDDGVTQILQVEYIRPHPESYREHSEYDFAIVQLRGRIKTSSKVHPVCVEHAKNSTFIDPYDFSSKFVTAPKKLSGYLRGINSTVFTTPYRLKAGDLCDSACQAQAPSSNEMQLQNEGARCPAKEREQDLGDTFLAGATVATWHLNRWYLAGITTKTYGCNNARFKHFVSPVAASTNLKWINANVAQTEGKYTCVSGERVDLNLLCNGQADCKQDGGSDEESSFCEALNCPPNSLNAALCSTTDISNDLRQIRNGPNSLLDWRAPGGSSFLLPPQHAPSTTTTVAPSTTQHTPSTTTTAAPNTTQRAPSTTTTIVPSTTLAWQYKPTPPITFTTSGKLEEGPTVGPSCPPIQLTPREKEGIRFACSISGKRSEISSGDCHSSSHSPGTKITQTCMPYYKPVGRASFSEMTCGSDGVWRRGRLFACVAECGLPKAPLTSHIVNGTEALASNWPWNVAIFKLVRSEYKYVCGATLISSGAIVTAAHCVSDWENDESIQVVLAPVSSEWAVNSNHIHSQILEDIQIHVHEHYNPTTFDADIAVIKTSRPVQISNHVYPACFPFPGRENEQIERYQTSPGSVGVVVGFGTDESFMISKTLKEVRLPVVSVRDCFRVLDVFPLTTQLCAGYTTGISVCNGDSGAGLMFQEEGARKLYFVQGIVSHGQSGPGGRLCDYNRYSMFTRVGAFKDWVEAIVQAD